MRRLALLSAVLLAATVFVATIAVTVDPAAAAPPAPAVTYRPPVDAPVTDSFRPPPAPWAKGNRGIDYAAPPGTPVGAAAHGEVTFAGPVAGALHVVVLHPDGIRTSYSFLRTVAVRRGDRVHQGQVLGTAGEGLHFGARVGKEYVDPALLLAAGPAPVVHLVPDPERVPAPEADERRAVQRLMDGLGRGAQAVGTATADWLRRQGAAGSDELRGALLYARDLAPDTPQALLVEAVVTWDRQRKDCTPEAAAVPRLPVRHLAVLVGGIGSSSDKAGIAGVDAAGLGYARDDVSRFSYRGGSTAESPYGPADTEVDIATSGVRLRAYLERLAGEHPGVPIDVIAHSQGGIVARAALDGGAPPGAVVGRVVTLGTPHQGIDLASAAMMWGRSGAGHAATLGAHEAVPGLPHPDSPAARQLARSSELLHDLNRRPLPAAIGFTSIGARGDLIVPADRTVLPGAQHTVAPVSGLHAHGDLPSSGPAQREVALAVNGRPPTCRSLDAVVADAVEGRVITGLESSLGMHGWAAGRLATPGAPG